MRRNAITCFGIGSENDDFIFDGIMYQKAARKTY